MAQKKLRTLVRDSAASVMRRLPIFRGFGRICDFIQHRTTDYSYDSECVVDCVSHRGYRARVDVRSRQERIVYWSGDYEPELYSLLRRLTAKLPPDAILFDIGANIGLVTIPLTSLTTGTIHAVEPFPDNVSRLHENLALNGLRHRVRVWQVALGKSAGTIRVITDDELTAETCNAYTAEASLVPEGSRSFDVPLMTFDSWSEQHEVLRCDFIKVDIEGGEFDFLLGAREVITRNIPTIVMELNYNRMRRVGWSREDLTTLIRPWGYSAYRFRNQRFEPLANAERTTENIVLIHAGKMDSI